MSAQVKHPTRFETSAYPDHLDKDERIIIDMIVVAALKADNLICVDGEGVMDLARTDSYAEITSVIGITGQTTLHIFAGDQRTATPTHLGSIVLVHGNLPSEVINDHTDSAAIYALIQPATHHCEALEANELWLTMQNDRARGALFVQDAMA